MHDWLVSLTRSEDPLLWTWVAIVVGYALVGLVLGYRAHPSAAARRTRAPPEPADSSSR